MNRTATTAFSFATFCLLVALSPPAAAQYGAVWETTIEVEAIDPSAASPTTMSPTPEADTGSVDVGVYQHTIDPSDLPTIPNYEDVLELNERARSATVPIRVIFRRDPLFTPDTVEVEGVATWVEPAGGGQPVLVTSSFLVQGAESVSIESPDGPISVNVQADARYGLAVVESVAPPAPGVALDLTAAESETVATVYGPLDGSMGSTVGNGEDETAYYQMNDLGITSGYPMVDNEGRIIGIGSHYHPAIPGRSLAVPADAVQRFLRSRE